MKPNGPDAVGRHVMLGEGGEIKAGMGGKFNGKKIDNLRGAIEIQRIKNIRDKAEAAAIQKRKSNAKSLFSKKQENKIEVKPNKSNKPIKSQIKKISDTEFNTTSNFVDGIRINSYRLNSGTWQSDVYVGLGNRKGDLINRNQHKTESSAKKWADNEMKKLEDKYRKK